MTRVTGIPEEKHPYLDLCPIGCLSHLVPTDIVLPEGPLRRCSDCGQLVSRCGEERYRQSLTEFDNPQGTLPGSDSLARYHRRAERCLVKIVRALKKNPQEIRLLDIGCSTGAFIAIANRMGFSAHGVEPAPQAARSAQDAGLRVHQGLLEEIAYAHIRKGSGRVMVSQGFTLSTAMNFIRHKKWKSCDWPREKHLLIALHRSSCIRILRR